MNFAGAELLTIKGDFNCEKMLPNGYLLTHIRQGASKLLFVLKDSLYLFGYLIINKFDFKSLNCYKIVISYLALEESFSIDVKLCSLSLGYCC